MHVQDQGQMQNGRGCEVSIKRFCLLIKSELCQMSRLRKSNRKAARNRRIKLIISSDGCEAVSSLLFVTCCQITTVRWFSWSSDSAVAAEQLQPRPDGRLSNTATALAPASWAAVCRICHLFASRLSLSVHGYN